MTKVEDFTKRGRCKNIHCSSMSNTAWTDLNSKGNILKLHDKCPNPKCGCHKNQYIYASSIYARRWIDKEKI